MAHLVPGNCPVCGEAMEVTRLYCPSCDTTIEGRFALPSPLFRLNAEQLHFVETFIRCEGTLKRVEKELGISYPTVRARLRDIIRAMGLEPFDDYAEQSERQAEIRHSEILDMLDRGEITSEEALALIRSK